MEIIKKTWIDHGTQDATFSVATQEYLIKDNGEQIQVGVQHRRAVTPLDKNNIDDIAPDIKSVLSVIWTDDVVKAYKVQIKKNEDEEAER